MTFGRVNASARKIASGCSRWIPAISHSQKANGLVWGLSTRKIAVAAGPVEGIQQEKARRVKCDSIDRG